jgi:spoIIIJ-associated protein
VVAVTGDNDPGRPVPPGQADAEEPASPPAGSWQQAAAQQPGEGDDSADAGATADDGAPDAAAGAPGTSPETGGGEDGDGTASEAGAAAPLPTVAVADLEQESEIAADYIEGLLDVADLDGDIDMDVEGDRPVVSVVGATLGELVGSRGEVLEALQELTRLAIHRETGERSRLMLDVGGYRARRRTELSELGRDAAAEVSRTGVARRLDAMTPFERKIVHDAVAAAGLRSESEGEEPERRVVVLPVA